MPCTTLDCCCCCFCAKFISGSRLLRLSASSLGGKRWPWPSPASGLPESEMRLAPAKAWLKSWKPSSSLEPPPPSPLSSACMPGSEAVQHGGRGSISVQGVAVGAGAAGPHSAMPGALCSCVRQVTGRRTTAQPQACKRLLQAVHAEVGRVRGGRVQGGVRAAYAVGMHLRREVMEWRVDGADVGRQAAMRVRHVLAVGEGDTCQATLGRVPARGTVLLWEIAAGDAGVGAA
eukprot:1148284-Pelagomonas_calceolata.AAC.5